MGISVFSVVFSWIIISTLFIPEMDRGEIGMCSSYGRGENVVPHNVHWLVGLRGLFGISSLFPGLEGLLRSRQAQRRFPLVTVYHVGCSHLISTALLSWTFALCFSF